MNFLACIFILHFRKQKVIKFLYISFADLSILPPIIEVSTTTTTPVTTSTVIQTTVSNKNVNQDTVIDVVITPDTSQVEGTSQVAEKVKGKFIFKKFYNFNFFGMEI